MIDVDRLRISFTNTLLLCLGIAWGSAGLAAACTTVLVGKLATVDGSVLMASSCDGDVMGVIQVMPARCYPPGNKLPMYWNLPRPRNLAEYAANLQWCEALVLVYPTWWSGQPAMLKGWIDRVWVNGVAWTLPEGANRLQPGLHNIRRLVAVTTHGSPKWINMVEGEGGKRTVTRSLRTMCHPRARTTWLAMYGIDTATDAQRTGFLDRVERRLTRLA